MKHMKIAYSAHQELSRLLPWYVNKTLQGSELKAVEDHLTVCLTCKRELIQLQKLAQAVIQEDSLDTAEQASFSRLKKRLHTAQQREGQALRQQVLPEPDKADTAKNVGQISNARKQGWMNSAIPRPALALAAVLLLSLLMPRYLETELKRNNDFRTLSNAQPEALSANEIRVVFAEGVDRQQKNKILARVHGQFTGGSPTAQGVYTVRLPRDITSKQLLDVVELLRKDSSVIFAEPAYALLSSMPTER